MFDDTYYRDKILELEELLDAADKPSEGSVCDVVETVKVGTCPTSANSYFAVRPLSVDGTEREGQSATFEADEDRVFYAANLGSQVPPEGTKLIITSVGGRWCFCFDGAGS